MAVWHGEEHHVHCHEGLPVSLQILLLGGQKLKGAYALGSSEAGHRLYT